MKNIIKKIGMFVFEMAFAFLGIYVLELDAVWYSIPAWIRYNDVVCATLCVGIMLGSIHIGRALYSRILKIRIPKTKIGYITMNIK